MQGPDQGGEHIAAINIIPLVDVMLVLLIIFMVTTAFSKDDSKMKIDLPKGSRAQVPGLPPAEITLAVDKDGQYFVNGKPVADVAELPRMVDAVRSQGRKCMIVIRGDKDVVYGKILPALDQVSQLPDVTITLAYAAPEAK